MLNTAALQNINHDMYPPEIVSTKDYVKRRIHAFRLKGKIVTRIKCLEMINITPQFMEQQREEQALQFGLFIDNVMHKARQELQIALQESLTDIPRLAAQQLRDKEGQPGGDLITAASQHRILALSQCLQQELNKYLGSPVEEHVTLPDSCRQMPTNKELQAMKREYKTTLFWSKMMTGAMNKAYQEALRACLPTLPGKFAEKIDVGAHCLSIVACHPVREQARCLREMQKQMQGAVKSYFLRLEYELISRFAKTAYQLFDEFVKTREAWQHQQNLRRSFIARRQQLLPAV